MVVTLYPKLLLPQFYVRTVIFQGYVSVKYVEPVVKNKDAVKNVNSGKLLCFRLTTVSEKETISDDNKLLFKVI